MPPAGSCCQAAGKVCPPDAARWSTPIWQALRVATDEPSYFSYQYQSDGQTFTARAHGDLDCDGTFSTFEIVGRIDGDGVKLSPMTRTQEAE